MDSSALAQVAGIIAAFGVAMIFFRIQRELEMSRKGEIVWIAWADWLLIAATLVALLLVIVPLLLVRQNTPLVELLARAACAASVIMLGGYIPGILSHYRIIFDGRRGNSRVNPEPAERLFVLGALALATIAAITIFFEIL